MRICYCIDSLSVLGGIQSVTVAKANALAAIPGNEVYILVGDTSVSNGATYSVVPAVKVIDLGTNIYGSNVRNLVGSLFNQLNVFRRLRRAYLRVFSEIRPDIVISTGSAEKFILPSVAGQAKCIREIHFAKHYRKLYARTFHEKIVAFIGEKLDYVFSIKRYDKVLSLTNEDYEENWKRWDKMEVMPNPYPLKERSVSTSRSKTIISTDRLDPIKNFPLLIKAFASIASAFPDWTLEIYGVGSKKEQLLELINVLGMTDRVFLKGYTSDVMSVLEKAAFFAFSSNCEGFPMSIIEAMGCGLPVVSTQCPCGPKDIITPGKDGFLVPVDDEKALAEKMSLLMADDELRCRMGAAARERAADFSIDKIIARQMDLFHRLTGKGE